MTTTKDKPWFCDTCGRAVRADQVPPGWYTISQSLPLIDGVPWRRMGMYCSTTCLADYADKLAEMDEKEMATA